MSQYNASTIEVLTGLDPVRKRPGMYTNTQDPNHLAQEVIDNSVDEVLAGYANKIQIIIYTDGSMSVTDNGRGMPVDEHPEKKCSGVEVILTTLHAGGKFSNKNYKYSGGLHGVGVSVVNALSKKLSTEVKRDGKLYKMEFIDGSPLAPLQAVDKVGIKNTGTFIHFHPDEAFFESKEFNLKHLRLSLRAKAVLCAGLEVSLFVEESNENQTWKFKDGIPEYLKKCLTEEPLVPNDLCSLNVKNTLSEVSMSMAWGIESYSLISESYVNTIPTIQGGTHVNGFRSGVTEAIREFLEIHNLLPRGVKIYADDVCQQLNFVLAIKVQDPQFLGQTKERLSSRSAANMVNVVIREGFALWLNQHMNSARHIVEIIISNARERQKSANKTVRKKILSGPALPGKLTDCVLQDIEQTELFLVEGNSAGGSARQARDKKFQAIMPLRGKIMNTWEASAEQILSSDEISDISLAIGIEPNSYDLSQLRYGKICILADADSDGLHIATLLCALFLKHYRALLERGHVFISMPPLYRIDIGKANFYALDDDEYQHIIKTQSKGNSKPQTTRFKGLGEMNAQQLRESTLHPDTRRLVQLTLDDIRDPVLMFDRLLAKKRSSDRKTWLESKGNMAEIN